MRQNVCVHRLDHALYSHPKELFARKVRTHVNSKGVHIKKILLRPGVPHGGVLSPTLCLLFVSDLVTELHKVIKAAMSADDLVMCCKEKYAATATARMQLAAVKLKSSWTEKWFVALNKDKSLTALSTLFRKQKAGTITVCGPQLKEDVEGTNLGVTFDKSHTWKPRIEKAEAKARRRLPILRKLAGVTWRASEKILKTV